MKDLKLGKKFKISESVRITGLVIKVQKWGPLRVGAVDELRILSARFPKSDKSHHTHTASCVSEGPIFGL